MLRKGIMSLSDAELLAILIGSGNRTESAVDLGRRILNTCNHNINELARLSVRDMCRKFKGIGEAKAIAITAALELGKRRRIKDRTERRQITSSNDLYELFCPVLMDLVHEELWIALLDGANRVIEMSKMTQGGSRKTVVDISQLLKKALCESAVAMAVAHNHPSGQKYPSRDDEMVTANLKAGCDAVGLRLLDHIIIAGGDYYSFCDAGRM